MDLWIIALLIVCSGMGAGVIYRVLRKSAARLQEMRTHAQSQGWEFAHSPASFSHGATTTLTCTPENWTLTYAFTNHNSRAVTSQLTWHSPENGLSEGTTVLRPLANKTDAIPSFASNLIKSLMLRDRESLRDIATGLKSVPDSILDGVVLATPGQEQGLDALKGNVAFARSSLAELIIIRDDTGITLRNRAVLKSMDQLTELAQLGVEIRATLGR